MLFAGVIRISKTCVLSSWKLLSRHICTFDYVVLQWSVRHLAAASETTMSFAAPIPLFLRFANTTARWRISSCANNFKNKSCPIS